MTGAHTPSVGHTAGPWSVEIEADCDGQQAEIYVCYPGTVCDATVVCTMGASGYVDPAQKMADARLIAAAPDLLASVIELLEPLERASAAMVADGKALNEAGEAAFDRARAAIARATSKEAQGNG